MNPLTIVQIIALIVQNAPEAIETAEAVFAYAQHAYAKVVEAYGVPAENITREMVLAVIDKIDLQSAELQNIT